MYSYRAVDSEGNAIDFYLSKSRDKQVAKCFFKKALAFSYVSFFFIFQTIQKAFKSYQRCCIQYRGDIEFERFFAIY